ncbi:hypothetical protein QJS04_geneDACA007669 [Acorus gramineus]|uniref:Uncharacterized protein n=1 Tax=Acorus gramineus TaxID=55184 RepID=A0AAV9B2F4_ACOGR|nr:hypothetical protein QJS04_geneDACA007669 [Acorus gramineus]
MVAGHVDEPTKVMNPQKKKNKNMAQTTDAAISKFKSDQILKNQQHQHVKKVHLARGDPSHENKNKKI